MAIETLRQDIEQLTSQLLQMTRERCWNTIPDEVAYIISEIVHDEGWEQRINRRRSKDGIEPISFDYLISELEERYPALHDINLHVHRAEKHRTIVDVQYYLKEKAGSETGDEVPSMLHAKVAIPPYRKDDSKKFDVHWGFGGFRHSYRMFWGRLASRMK